MVPYHSRSSDTSPVRPAKPRRRSALEPIWDTKQDRSSVSRVANDGEVLAVDQVKRLLPSPETTTHSAASKDCHQGMAGDQVPSRDYHSRVDEAHGARPLRRSVAAPLTRPVFQSQVSSRKSGGESALELRPTGGSQDEGGGDRGSNDDRISQIEAVAAFEAMVRTDQVQAVDGKPAHGSQKDWLSQHAADLIRKIQTWADALDSREMQLNARVLRHEQRERRFRLRWQDLELDLSEQRNAIDQLQQAFTSQSQHLDRE
jgi:hypothetical protein